MKTLALLILLPLCAAQDSKPKTEAKKPDPPKEVEITGAAALRVLSLHWRAVAVQSELQKLNERIKAATVAACEEKKIGADCKIVAIGEESITAASK